MLFDPTAEPESRAEARARRSVAGRLSLRRAEELLTNAPGTGCAYEEALWSWKKIRRMCMPGPEGHKFANNAPPAYALYGGAPLVFRRHADDPVKGRGTFACYPIPALGFDAAKYDAHVAHAARRAEATAPLGFGSW